MRFDRFPVRGTLLLLTLLAPAFAIAQATRPTTAPAQLGWTPRQVRWQLVPDEIAAVRVGLDERVWSEVDGEQNDPNRLEAHLASQFASAAPRVVAASVVLFEPAGGRVWFRGHGRLWNVLFGYDGKAWVRHAGQANQRYRGVPLNHASPDSPPCYNAFAGGAAFFPDTCGVDVFDGKGWTYERFTADAKDLLCQPLTYAEADGNGVVAVAVAKKPPAADAAPGARQPVEAELIVRRWRDGRWSESSRQPTGASFSAAAPTADGIWVLSRDQGLRSHPHDAAAARERYDRDVEQLAAADADVREAAAARLTSAGDAARPLLERVLAESQDAEQIARLQQILVEINAPPGAAAKRRARFGPYELGEVHALVRLADGTAVVVGGDVRLANRAPAAARGAIVVLDPRGHYRAVYPDDADLLGAWGGLPELTPLRTRSGLWISTYWSKRPGVYHIRLDDGAVTARVPHASFCRLQAVRGDGTLFVRSASTVAYNPDAPEDRPILKAERFDASGEGLGVASDGAVWAHRAGEGLLRFNGLAWRARGVLKDQRRVSWMIAGAGGQMFTAGDGAAALVGPGGPGANNPTLVGQSPAALILANRDRFVAAFPPGLHACNWGMFATLFADARQNLWFLHGQRLSVLAGDRWLDPQLALRAIGAGATVRYAATIGDGAKVYVTDFDRLSAIGDVRGQAQLVFASVTAPQMDDRSSIYRTVRDAEGALWLSVNWGNPSGQDGSIRGQYACRLTERGIETWLPRDAGRPVLIESNGTLWLERQTNYRRRNVRLALWRDGRRVHELALPGAGEFPVLFAEQPGSVFAWTDAGLHHFTAANPDDPSTYALSKTYGIDDISHTIRRAAFSPGGFLVLTGDPPLREEGIRGYLIRLPR